MTFNRVSSCCVLILLFTMVSFIDANEKIQVYLVGDSTLFNKERKARPETGWGMPFTEFFDDQVIIKNVAQNGRSTKSFIAERRWSEVRDSLKKGDFVFIQFGHNDEVKTKVNYTAPEEFKSNLRKFVLETRSKMATPILITPVSRRKFDSLGVAMETHPIYAQFVRDVALKEHVALIDLDQKSIDLFNNLGPKSSVLLFNHLEPGEHPNYPDGKIDDTHFNELGARRIAEIVLKEIRELDISLKYHIIKLIKND